MNSNQFNASENEVLNEILQEIRKIKEHTTADDVIEYLQTNYGIETTTRNFYIHRNIPVKSAIAIIFWLYKFLLQIENFYIAITKHSKQQI